MATRSKTSVRGRSGVSSSNDQYGMEESSLMKLFENELKDIYWAEKAIIKGLSKMIKQATSEELIDGLENHLNETEGQVQKLEQVFDIIGKRAQGKKCEAMAGILKEGDEIMKESEKGAMRDAGIITACQKVEHYEIASYGTLRTFADTLGISNAASLLEEILEQEKSADETLTRLAVSAVNINAAEEVEDEEE
jgi:ferritin-like metal-binding protein YciE